VLLLPCFPSTSNLTASTLVSHFLPQDLVLFNDTIYYNIAYGRLGASREEVETAAKQVSSFSQSVLTTLRFELTDCSMLAWRLCRGPCLSVPVHCALPSAHLPVAACNHT
jgi:hypothetical protein